MDLLEVRQTTGTANDLVAAYANYTASHQPQSVTDAAGQTTTMTYTAAGQVATVTNALQETTTYTYDTEGHLTSVTGPVSGATTTYTHDAYGRPRTVTQDGVTITTDYDLFDRPTSVWYPDGTREISTYDRLDLATSTDRLGRETRYITDGLRRRVATRDPAGRTIRQVFTEDRDQLVDANGQATTWERDLLGRVTREVRADGVTATVYTYQPRSGRLATVTDPKGQVTTYTYAHDDALLGMRCANAAIATPGVNYTYEAVYGRTATMLDGIGTTTYTYHPAGQVGAGQVATVDGPLTDDTIAYTYDALGRVVQRTINGAANSLTYAYDTLGRVTTETNVLGTFTYGYDGTSARLESVTYPNGQTSAYAYLPASQEHRLQTIHHQLPGATTLSRFDYTYDAVGNIVTWQQQAGTADPELWRYRYDRADQLLGATVTSTGTTPTVLKRYAYGYDPAGNRLFEQIDDGVTAWTYDALNRLQLQAGGGVLQVEGLVNEPAYVRIQGQAAAVTAAGHFQGGLPVAPGTNVFTVEATDGNGNTATAQYEVDVTNAPKTFTYDANGNLTVQLQGLSPPASSTPCGTNAREELVLAECYVMPQQQRAVVPSDEYARSPDSLPTSAPRAAASPVSESSLRAAHSMALRPSVGTSASWAFEERVAALRNERFTERQAAFLVTVMLHGGVCMVRQYCAFAGIAHGQNARDFFARLAQRRIATPYAALHARARLYHIHHRRLYTAIGEPHSRFRKPLPAGRAMERLMMLDAIFEQPAIPWLATEGDKWAHFIRTFGTAITVEWMPQLRFGIPPRVTVRYFPDRQPIGVVEAGEAYTFLYLATKPSTVDLHAFLQRHAELLRTIRRWTVRALLPPHLSEARELYLRALRQELGTRMAPHMADEFRWWCRARKAGAHARLATDAERWTRASRAFASPRFRALYQSWCMLGDYVIDSAISPVLADAMERGTGRVECEVLTRPYLHLSTLVGTA